MATKTKKSRTLTLHHLIAELSYWGSAVRLLLVGFLAAVVLIVRISELESSGMTLGAATSTAGAAFLYVIGSFLLLEVGYLMLARSYRLVRGLDRLLFFGSEAVLALAYFLPYFALIPAWFVTTSRFLFVAVLLILGMRLLIGFLYGKRA